MKTIYRVELRVKKMYAPDGSGNGPFTRADDREAGLKVFIYPEVWENPAARELILRNIEDSMRRFYAGEEAADELVMPLDELAGGS